MSPSFMEFALTGTEPAKESLLPEFMAYISTTQAKLLERAFANFSSVELDELIKLFDEYGVHVLPTEATLNEVLADVAHAVFIQTPCYVAKTWREPLQLIRKYLTSPIGNMTDMIPTFEKVWKIINIPDNLSTQQRSQITFLKRVLREMEVTTLKRFLRFCTGADILNGKSVKINFISGLGDFERRPVGHTCGCVLDLPDNCNYTSFLEMRNDWMKILTSSEWEMDYV